MSHEVISLIRDALIANANARGVLLQDEFKSREAFQHYVLSASILAVQGALECEFKVAYDLVMGDGSYRNLADSIYSKLVAA